MEQENSIISRLMWWNPSTPNATHAQQAINNENEVLITSHRVISTRYRIYVGVLVVLGVIFVMNYLLPSYKSREKLKFKLIEIEGTTSIFESRKNKFALDSNLISQFDTENVALVNYFVSGDGYESLAPILQNNISTVKSYLQLNTLYNPKMLVDERVLLANINEYLFKQQDGSKRSNGVINKIEIGEPMPIDEFLYQIPILLNASFKDQNGLLSFINNVEKHIVEDPAYRVLYQINEINYDVVNYTDAQDVDISLSAYYYTATTEK